ncbi:hypothetical protein CspeluHIS016_0300440 [Cutaneotrichosporon spelunceum]|uniref:DUF4604 domain-containing protein n=1 Tax=Cutaneotrichosporon spelunceum TaxID=1672016 RepID=A0AAD3TSX1_9TREE|nr:hypothetical protein CspeluHIS016_0300440 [Cutaneotrichosporon spelunceum]
MPPRREPSRAQISSGLSYVAQKPAFLANFGQPSREPVPTRPDEGEWAEDSDEDDWDKKFGGEDGPQVVVIREGRHLSADEVARERRRAKGERTPSPKPPAAVEQPANESTTAPAEPTAKPGPIPRPKRRLVGEAVEHEEKGDKPEGNKKKKKKANKQMLSFNEAEGE